MRTLVISIFLLVIAAPAAAQGNARIEAELVEAFKDVRKYSTYVSGGDAEKLSRANQVFKEKLLKYTEIPSTLAYEFRELDKYMHNAVSEDGRLRIYSWDTEEGGTMRFFDRVYQYRGADGKVYSRSDPPADEYYPGSFALKIFHLGTKSGRIYIVSAMSVGTSIDYYQSADVYKITGNVLTDRVKVIKTRSGLTNSVGFGYNLFSAMARRRLPGELISFNRKTKTLKIPVVIKDQEYLAGGITNRSISYRFNGKYFIKLS
jgi:hypothetical protein